MLQDLDKLAARIGQMVQTVRQLQSERTDLHARLVRADTERQALERRCAELDEQFMTLSAKAGEHASEMSDLRTLLEAGQQDARGQAEQLRVQLENERAAAEVREQALLRQIKDQEHDAGQLRYAAHQARERVDALLARLPGGQIQEGGA